MAKVVFVVCGIISFIDHAGGLLVTSLSRLGVRTDEKIVVILQESAEIGNGVGWLGWSEI